MNQYFAGPALTRLITSLPFGQAVQRFSSKFASLGFGSRASQRPRLRCTRDSAARALRVPRHARSAAGGTHTVLQSDPPQKSLPPSPAAHAPIDFGRSNPPLADRVGYLPPAGSMRPFHDARQMRARLPRNSPRIREPPGHNQLASGIPTSGVSRAYGFSAPVASHTRTIPNRTRHHFGSPWPARTGGDLGY